MIICRETKGDLTMPKMNIIAYLKPTCGWSNGVRAVLKKHNLSYVDRDIINDPANYEEMVGKSGQPLSPCVEINGQMLADVSGDEVEAWLIKTGLVTPSDAPAESPTGAGCAHETPRAVEVDFRS